MTEIDLLFRLREANIKRNEIWCPDEKPDMMFRAIELGGEAGEVLNVVKKLERERKGWRGKRDTLEHLAEELADVIITDVNLSIITGINLHAAIINKFNLTSRQNNLPLFEELV